MINFLTLFWKILKVIFVLIFFYFIINWLTKNTNIGLAQIVLDYLKTIIWPITVIIIAFCFRTEISSLIKRIISAELPGLKLNAIPQEKAEESNLEFKLQNLPDDEKNKLEELIQEKENALSSASQNIDELNKTLVQKEIEVDFERIYNIIFGSQINLLNKMAGTLGYLGTQNVIQHFVLIQKAFEPMYNEWNFSTYLQFLYSQNLIVQRDNYTIGITDKGKAFLQYVSIMNYQKYGS